MKKIITLFTLIVLLMIGWFFASPYYTVYQLKNAYTNHDTQTINHYIDFPSVQADIKNQLTPVLVKKVQTLTQSPLAKLLNLQVDEKSMVEKLVTQAVDNTVTPTGVSNVLSGQTSMKNLDNNAKLLGGLTAIAMDKIKLNPETLADLVIAKNTEELNQKLLTQLKASDMANGGRVENNQPIASYCGINCFTVQTQVQGYPLIVTMARQGFATWQIIGVKLPL